MKFQQSKYAIMCLRLGSGEVGDKRSDGVERLFSVIQISKDDGVVLGLGRDE